MNILGLHFGHDAAAMVLRDGRIASYVSRERWSRIKYAATLEIATMAKAAEAAGISLDDIDACAITSTQDTELIIDNAEDFSVSLTPHPESQGTSSFARLLAEQRIDVAGLTTAKLLPILYERKPEHLFPLEFWEKFYPEHRTLDRSRIAWFPWLDRYADSASWKPATLDELAATDFSPVLGNDELRYGLHYPVTAKLKGRRLPGYFVHHHMSHAASSYYQSGYGEAAILTHDGFGEGPGLPAGVLAYARDHRIYPITPHHLHIGILYTHVAWLLKLTATGGPGKLMGLAAYGRPRFFDRSFVGNVFDWMRKDISSMKWMQHCKDLARTMGYDLGPLGDLARMTAPINADIAASTQCLFESTMMATTEVLHKILMRLRISTPNLCLSGGAALNCPCNTRIFRESRFPRVFIEPGCNDGGLAIGAATFIYHNILNHPVAPQVAGTYATPYLGVDVTPAAVDAALSAAGDQVRALRLDDAAAEAANDLANNMVIGWFEGRSEIGPRALGHRSILADPRDSNNWRRVNAIKGRESWRPLAPAVLEAEAAKWFYGAPDRSPYMLFNSTVRSTAVPAITHADGSARLQTVDPSCGRFFNLLTMFFEKTGIPLVLNTSFNGPGEPIVESPQDALRFLINSSLDALYIGGRRVTRA